MSLPELLMASVDYRIRGVLSRRTPPEVVRGAVGAITIEMAGVITIIRSRPMKRLTNYLMD